MSDQTKLSTLKDDLAPVTMHYTDTRGYPILELRLNGRLLFLVDEEDIFDHNGNFFDNDLELETVE